MTSATFTSQKLDLINAISLDRRLLMSSRCVAVVLLSHANSTDWAIFPSQERIAALVGMTERQVRACVQQLVQHGWLRTERAHRNQSNRYAFDAGQVECMLARRETVAAVSRGSRVPVEGTKDRKQASSRTGSAVPLATGSAVPPNYLHDDHLKASPERPVHEGGLDSSVEQYADRQTHLVVGTDPTSQFDRMLAEGK